MEQKILQFIPYIGKEEYDAIKDCFESCWLTEGEKSKKFIEQLQVLTGAKYACLAPNGTLSLYLGLRALGIGSGDEVIVPDFTFMGSASAVEMTGATPVFCDISPVTLQTEAHHISRVITSRTRAIMPVHIYGAMCDMDPILKLAKDRSLLVIEDAAQALGVRYKGRHAGTLGNVGCFSFFADKTMTTGEGGLVVTNDEEIQQSLLYLRNQGRIDRGSFIHPRLGYNFRMTDIQAAIGLVQLAKLDKIIRLKADIMARYRERLEDIIEIRFVDLVPGSMVIPFRVAVYAERVDELMRYLESRNIQCRTFFYPLHKQPAFNYLKKDSEYSEKMNDRNFPGTIYAYTNGVCLPSYPNLSEKDLNYVCDKIREFYGKQ
jgi:perosamine synthetase